MTGHAPKRRSFLRDVMDVGAARVIVLLATLGANVIIARTLGPEGKGAITALTVVPFLIITLAELGLRQATTYHIGRKTFDAQTVVSTLILLYLASSVIGVLICLIYFNIAWQPQFTVAAVIAATLFIPFGLMRNYTTGIFLGMEKVAVFSRVNWMPGVTQLIVLGILALIGVISITGAVWAALIGVIVVAAYAARLVAREVRLTPIFDKDCIIAMLRLGGIFAVALFLISLNYKINIFLLQYWSDLEQVGIYALGESIAELIWQVPGTMSAVILSRSANAKNDAQFTERIGILLRLSVIIGIIGATGLGIVSPVLIPLVFGAEFADSAQVLILLLPGIVAFVIFKILNVDLAGKGRPWVSMLVIIPALGLNAAAASFLIPAYGAEGAAIACSISYLGTAAAFTVLYCRVTKTPLVDFVTPRMSDLDFLIQKVPALRVLRPGARP
ncbi:oligosaccharide flippase family protein [Pontivivens ytuae]|uniref:Oligosaccharide flippase family protein n=1 Tax=Pontivivens ytuae TaxID=2789856 RepID=A0A7S9LNR9_9RHOB|nr:oligosaccharide flippase family protein [Pontivivens ytuae]QPH52210.1 oligosaccharide flippase family protein [Pontivivens ytuae]